MFVSILWSGYALSNSIVLGLAIRKIQLPSIIYFHIDLDITCYRSIVSLSSSSLHSQPL